MGIENSVHPKHRAPTVAGIFYPEDRLAVEAALAEFRGKLQDGGTHPGGSEVRDGAAALIVPHAGWELSGLITAAAFRRASSPRVKTVVLIGPRHQGATEGIFLSESDYFQTPIGDIAVDRELCEELESCGTLFETNDIPHLEEHSIEILLPFVKSYFPGASIVPILTAGSKDSVSRTLARGLDFVMSPLAESVLIVVSTNLCANLETGIAHRHADAFLGFLAAGDAAGLSAGLSGASVSACGGTGCAALMETGLIGDGRPEIVASGDSSLRIDHDPRRLVRYASLAYY